MNTSSRSHRAMLIRLGLISWLAIVVLGFIQLENYNLTPATTQAAAPTWPVSSGLQRVAGLSSLIMFVHPQCPCTSASVSMLNSLLSKIDRKIDAQVVFVIPPGRTIGFEQGALWEQVGRLGDVRRTIDQNGKLAQLMGVQASGHTLLYAPDGTLQFSGGLTPSRGHQGISHGFEALRQWINRGHHNSGSSLVYGCSLVGMALGGVAQ